jgi:hypothetical protein
LALCLSLSLSHAAPLPPHRVLLLPPLLLRTHTCMQAVIPRASFLKDVAFYLLSLVIIAYMLGDGKVSDSWQRV